MVITIIIVIVLVVFGIGIAFSGAEEDKQNEQCEEFRDSVINKWGKPTLELNTQGDDYYSGVLMATINKTDSRDNVIMVYDTKQMIILKQIALPYSGILDFKVNEQMSYKTSVSNGNMIGRAVVGDILAGGIGAIIGGSTAQRNTESTVENIKVVVFTRNMNNPSIRLDFKDEKQFEIFYGVLKNIIDMN